MLFTQPTFIEGVYNFWIVDGLQRRGFRPNTNAIQDLINGGGGGGGGENIQLLCRYSRSAH